MEITANPIQQLPSKNKKLPSAKLPIFTPLEDYAFHTTLCLYLSENYFVTIVLAP